ncbi:MAG: NAD(P)-dependent alcohol dehydrogenase [Reyranellaceae bacterium]
MKAYEIEKDWGIDNLVEVERAKPKAGPGQVVVAIKACSLNYRDLLTVLGKGGAKLPLIPFSDGAGDIVETGEGVTRVKKGDRVCPIFFPGWLDGGPSAYGRMQALGGSAPGTLQEFMVLDAEAVTPIPAHLSYLEASTLPCAAVTAWRALVDEGRIKKDDWVLVQGTGGVSIFALQFAKMLGAKVVVTSSSDEKLECAKKLGADATINYRTTPEWAKAAMQATGGQGVDIVVEVGGAGTLNQSLSCARVGGTIVVIGLLTGVKQEVLVNVIFGKNLRVIGISVGSRAQFEAMNKAIAEHRMKPVIDKVLPVSQVRDALKAMQAAGHFGKICVEFGQ